MNANTFYGFASTILATAGLLILAFGLGSQ